MPHVHFIAIGGTGMSGIAKVLLEMGYVVSGSDLKETEGTRRLESMGASVFLGHRANNLDRPDVVVVSSAVPEDNEELLEAKARSIPVLHRGEMLAKLMEGRKGISVAGAHGKTTTTSMIAMVLEKGGLNPTVLVGGEVADFGGNAKLGRGEYLVAEADESDGSFLKLRPHLAVVTNIDDDHLDYYGSIGNIVAAFGDYIRNVGDDGFRVLCFDDPRVRSIASGIGGRNVTYGITGAWDYTAINVNLEAWTSSFDVRLRGEPAGRLTLQIPGIHNVVNSLAAIAVGMEVGLSLEAVRDALEGFHGVQRRLQTIACAGGIRILDDYGHHPTEIATTLKAVRQATKGKIICVFQPHRFSRTFLLQDEFGTAFHVADEVILLDIYPGPGEKPLDGVTSEMIASSIRRRDGKKVAYIREKDEAVRVAAGMAMPGDVIITVGAGDVWTLAPRIATILRDRAAAGHGHAHPT
ncbi:MAG: UDP-N-acetylmuramate--L-alanine ligase [Firmicutes bacterium]|nr:UDP-N-acetylmuramate--L-alanine ligase [Bacillota bacterium]